MGNSRRQVAPSTLIPFTNLMTFCVKDRLYLPRLTFGSRSGSAEAAAKRVVGLVGFVASVLHLSVEGVILKHIRRGCRGRPAPYQALFAARHQSLADSVDVVARGSWPVARLHRVR